MRRSTDVIRSNLWAEMARRGWSQQDLGERMGRLQPWVSRRMSGRVGITTDDLQRFAEALGVTVERLVKDHDAAVA